MQLISAAWGAGRTGGTAAGAGRRSAKVRAPSEALGSCRGWSVTFC